MAKLTALYFIFEQFPFLDLLSSFNTYYLDDIYTLCSPFVKWNRGYRKEINSGPVHVWYNTLNKAHKRTIDGAVANDSSLDPFQLFELCQLNQNQIAIITFFLQVHPKMKRRDYLFYIVWIHQHMIHLKNDYNKFNQRSMDL